MTIPNTASRYRFEHILTISPTLFTPEPVLSGAYVAYPERSRGTAKEHVALLTGVRPTAVGGDMALQWRKCLSCAIELPTRIAHLVLNKDSAEL